MNANNTTLGGSQEAFPETTVGVLGEFARGPEGLGRVCAKYWKPVYAYVRAAWAKSNEDAKDLAQAFFLWLLEEQVLAQFDPARGRLRAFLKTILRRFVGHKEAAMNRLKRGGGVRTFSIDDTRTPEMKDPSGDPESLFDRAWVMEVVGSAVERVKARCDSPPQVLAFGVYEAYALGPETERPAYADVARRFGLLERQVKQHIFDVRQQIRREIRAELAQVAGTTEEINEEWRELFGL